MPVAKHQRKEVWCRPVEFRKRRNELAYDHFDLEWSLVVLGRDDHGQFRALDRDGGMHVLDDARRVLVEKMALATGSRVPSPSTH